MSARSAFVPQNTGVARPPSRISQGHRPGPEQNTADLVKPNKPLNMAGLRRSATPASIGDDLGPDFGLPRRIPITQRPSTTEPSHRRASLQIAAPTPSNASPINPINEFLSGTGFKLPSMPASASNDAHITSEQNSLTVSMPLHHTSGPRRVTVETGSDQDQLIQTEDAGLRGDALRTRRRSKRSRADFDAANESHEFQYESMTQAKRFKPNDYHNAIKEVPTSRPQASQHVPSSPASVHSRHFHLPELVHSNDTAPLEYDQGFVPQEEDVHGEGPILDRILGRDVEAFITRHCLEKYAEAEGRWKVCSMEEWVQGGEEIMGKYRDIMEKVQKRMSAKMKLYAGFDACVSEHQNVLKQREQNLNQIQQNLVKGSGSVIVDAGPL